MAADSIARLAVILTGDGAPLTAALQRSLQDADKWALGMARAAHQAQTSWNAGLARMASATSQARLSAPGGPMEAFDPSRLVPLSARTFIPDMTRPFDSLMVGDRNARALAASAAAATGNMRLLSAASQGLHMAGMHGAGGMAGMASSLTGLAGVASSPVLIGGGLAIALGAITIAGIKAAAAMENMKISFEVMTGSAETAAALIGQMRGLAIESPLGMEEIQKAGNVLLAMGEHASEVVGEVKMLGDVASGTGQNLTELAQVFGQVMQAGRLTGNELRQFNERGVPLLTTLATQMVKTKAEIRGMVEGSQISSQDVVNAFRAMTSAGGQFNNMMERQTNTLTGQWARLKDTTSMMAADTFAPAGRELKEWLTVINASASAIQRFGQMGEEANHKIAAAQKPAIDKAAEFKKNLEETQKEIDKAWGEEQVKAFSKLESSAESLAKSLRTPREEFIDALAQAGELLQAGLITASMFERASEKAANQFKDAEKSKLKAEEKARSGVAATDRFSTAGFSAVQGGLREIDRLERVAKDQLKAQQESVRVEKQIEQAIRAQTPVVIQEGTT